MDITNTDKVSVDLTHFYEDYRRFCWVHLDFSRMRTVNDLKTYLLNTFHIQGESKLMLDDCLLLEDTDLKILRDGDHICLIDCSKYQCGTSSDTSAVKDSTKSQTSSEATEEQTQVITESQGVKKKKPTSPEAVGKVSSKKVKATEAANDTASVQVPKKSKKKDKSADKNQVEELPDQNGQILTDDAVSEETTAPAIEDEVDWSSFPVPKRKRNRKHRKRNKTGDTSTVLQMPLEPIPTHFATAVPPPPVIHHPQRLHIRFDEPKPEIVTNPCVTNQNDLEVPMITEPIPCTSLPTTVVKPKVRQDFSELLSRKKPIVFELKPSTLCTPQKVVEPDNSYWDSVTETQIWNSTISNTSPFVNDVLAFKVLCLADDYTPQLSPWIIARVTQEANDDGKHTLEILSGVNPFIRDSEGKFEMEELAQKQQEKVLVINWQDLMATRKLDTPAANGIH